MALFSDRAVQFPNRVKLTPVNGQQNVYDVERQEGTISSAGTPLTAENLNRLRLKEALPAAGSPTRAYVAFSSGDGYMEVTSGWAANTIVQRNFRGTFEIPTPQQGWDIHSCATLENCDIVQRNLDNFVNQLKAKVKVYLAPTGNRINLDKPTYQIFVVGSGDLIFGATGHPEVTVRINRFAAISVSRNNGGSSPLGVNVVTGSETDHTKLSVIVQTAVSYSGTEVWKFSALGSVGGGRRLSYSDKAQLLSRRCA